MLQHRLTSHILLHSHDDDDVNEQVTHTEKKNKEKNKSHVSKLECSHK